jgi:hypothetical protein
LKISKEYAQQVFTLLKEICGDKELFWYQKKIFEDLFLNQKKEVFLNIPRKSGKTEDEIRFLAIKAMLIPKGEFYFVSFTQDNAMKTMWGRSKKMIPSHWLAVQGFKETNKEIHFDNGSIIYVLGCNMNTDCLIGTEPDSVVFDEFRVHKQEFHDVMHANCFKAHCQILYGSTPPDLLDVESGRCKFYTDQMEICQKADNKSYYTFECWEGNPLPDVQAHYREALEKAQQSGRMAEFQREFLAKLVKGSQDSLLPEFNDEDLIPHQDIMAMIKYIKKPLWVVGNDTSGLSRYGHLFMVLDEDRKDIYVLDAITRRSTGDSRHDREAAKMTGQLMWPEIEEKIRELNPGSSHKDWHFIWDTDTQIIDDIHRWHGDDIDIIKVNKKRMTKEQSYGLIRDLKILNKIKVGARASELIDEAKCYHLAANKENAKKTYDELIDGLRYVLYEFDYLFDAECLETSVPKTYDAEREFMRNIEELSKKQDDIFRTPEYLIKDDYL